MEVTLEDKDEQIIQLKAAAVMASTAAETHSADVTNIEESLEDKERLIDKYIMLFQLKSNISFDNSDKKLYI